jgi:hypothetical protein
MLRAVFTSKSIGPGKEHPLEREVEAIMMIQLENATAPKE